MVTASRRFIGYDPQVQLPDQRTELALGDLVSGEERYVVLMLEVLPLVFINATYVGVTTPNGKNCTRPSIFRGAMSSGISACVRQRVARKGGVRLTSNGKNAL